MTTLYVLDIPEFDDLVRVARDTGYGIRSAGDYVEVTADGPWCSPGTRSAPAPRSGSPR